MRLWCAGLFTLVLAGGCGTTRPAQVTPRTGTVVGASFGKTWDALLTVVSEQGIRVRDANRPTGFVVAEEQPVSDENDNIADCGRALRTRVYPVRARWSMLVRGDSANSVVKTTVQFVDPTGDACASLGNWEIALERRIKAVAERGATASR